jgi:hypothetical protein
MRASCKSLPIFPISPASGLKRQDNDLIMTESAGAAAAFKRAFEARFASGENLSNGVKRRRRPQLYRGLYLEVTKN